MQAQEIVGMAGTGIIPLPLPQRRTDDNPLRETRRGFLPSPKPGCPVTQPAPAVTGWPINCVKPIKTPVELLIGKSTHKLIAESFLARAANMIPARGSDRLAGGFLTDEMKAPATRAEMEQAKRESGRYACLFIQEVDGFPGRRKGVFHSCRQL